MRQNKPLKTAASALDEKNGMKQYSFRMKESEFDLLMQIFDDSGLLFSQGLRKMVREYLKNHGKL